jgi:coenzyme F420 hydrogenase subunit beta
MVLQNGYYVPEFYSKLTVEEEKNIYSCCPGIHIESEKECSGIWGKCDEVKEAWSSDASIRQKSSSGGVLTSISVFLLESKQVDAILHVGVSKSSYLYNELKISYTKEQVLENSGSRYAPALMFNSLKKILDSTIIMFAFVGKPCDIAAIKNFIHCFPQYKNRIKYSMAMFCAGIPSYNATKRLLELSGYEDDPYYLKYRGEGWPGYFEAKYKDKPTFRMTYNDSWGKFLGRDLRLRCKICPDGIGLLADLVAADSWNIKNKTPIFEEDDGRSLVIVRNIHGKEILDQAIKNRYIIQRDFNVDNISIIQPYQYQRRLYAGYRILPIQLFSLRLLHFKGLGIIKLIRRASILEGIKNMLGTIKRCLFKK